MGALSDKYCIVGVGETPHMRPSNRTTLSMACEAITNAMADAGLQASDIDGMTSYQAADSTTSAHVATALGMRLNYCLDIFGGVSPTPTMQYLSDNAPMVFLLAVKVRVAALSSAQLRTSQEIVKAERQWPEARAEQSEGGDSVTTLQPRPSRICQALESAPHAARRRIDPLLVEHRARRCSHGSQLFPPGKDGDRRIPIRH